MGAECSGGLRSRKETLTGSGESIHEKDMSLTKTMLKGEAVAKIHCRQMERVMKN